MAAKTPHSVTLAWDPAVSSGSFTYVIEASFGYRAFANGVLVSAGNRSPASSVTLTNQTC